MTENFVFMMEESIENENRIVVSGETSNTHFISTVVPVKMRADDGIYIETEEGMIIDIRDDYEVEYDEYEEMYIISCQDGIKYYFCPN